MCVRACACVCVCVRACAHVCVCVCLRFTSVIRCNSSKEFIFIDARVLPSGDTNNSHIAESSRRQFIVPDKSHSQLLLTSRPSLVRIHYFSLQ